MLIGASCVGVLGCDSSEPPPSTAVDDTGVASNDAHAGDDTGTVETDATVEAAIDSAIEGGEDATSDGLSGDTPYGAPDAVDVPALPVVDVSKLPKDDAGRPLLLDGPRVSIAVGPAWKNSASALARCAAMVTHCVDLPTKTLDACMFSVPRCKTDKPWDEATACCPTACWDRYELLRKAGVSPIASFDQVLFVKSCMPGAPALIGGAK